MIKKINSLWKNWNRDIALELTNCVLRLIWWLSANPRTEENSQEWDFQLGKIYGYLYCLEIMEFAKAISVVSGEEKPEGNKKYVAIFKKGLVLDNMRPYITDEGKLKTTYRNYFFEKEFFDDALNLSAPDLRKKILETLARV